VRKMLKKLFSNQSGVSVTEFGLIAPVFLLMIMGTYDIGHQIYLRAMLNGALQEVGRDSSLEGASNADQRDVIDTKLRTLIADLAPKASVDITRRYYKTFSTAASADAEQLIEDEEDANGQCDSGETFMDANHNGVWDADGGDAGQGGAKDVVIIKVIVRYERLFPAAGFIGYGNNVALVSDSVIANQPYGQQQQYAAPVSVDCP
jgi:Flp pilus assembly pilin Flp